LHAHPEQQGSPAEYRFYTEFQSHEAEFDYLKSLEIEEKINQIEWLKRSNVRRTRTP
jgi:serine/threonine-protein phosphatase 2A regulatory subunit B